MRSFVRAGLRDSSALERAGFPLLGERLRALLEVFGEVQLERRRLKVGLLLGLVHVPTPRAHRGAHAERRVRGNLPGELQACSRCCPSGATRSMTPAARASSAVKKRPVIAASVANDPAPRNLSSAQYLEEAKPRDVSVTWKRVPASATTISLSSTMPSPRPTAKPCGAAMIGFQLMARVKRSAACAPQPCEPPWRSKSSTLRSWRRCTSAPLENARPSPRSTATSASGSTSNSCSTCASLITMASLNAFSLWGRLNVIVAMRSRHS